MNSVEVIAPKNKISRHRIRQLQTKKSLSQFGGDPRLKPPSRVPCASSSAFYIAATNRNLRARIQSSDHLRQDCRIVLKVGVYDSNIVTGRRQKALYHGWTEAAIRGAAKNPNARILSSQFLSNSPCAIGRIVVYNEEFVVDSRQYSGHVMNEAWDVFGFVICRRNYSYFHNLHSVGIMVRQKYCHPQRGETVDVAALDCCIELLGLRQLHETYKSLHPSP